MVYNTSVKDKRRPTQIDLEFIREAHIALHLKEHDGAGKETQKKNADLIKRKGRWWGRWAIGECLNPTHHPQTWAPNTMNINESPSMCCL
jgi:hypothetical protein